MDIYDEIKAERAKQKNMWRMDSFHSHTDWSGIITHELGQAVFIADEERTFREQMVKIAAVAVAAIEAVDRRR
jgi:hypothetical protein